LDSGECAKKPFTAEIAEGLAEDAEKSFWPRRAQRKAARDAKEELLRWPGKQIPPASATLGVGMKRFAKEDA
jgi:hypothetical protein